MPDLNQIVLTLVILALTTLVIFLGIEVYYILKEVRRGVQKVNKMLDDTGLITESIAKPISNASGFLMGLKSGAKLISSILGQDKEEKTKDKEKS
jgi:hypothetical protein